MTLRTRLIAASGIALPVFCVLGVLSYRWTLRADEDQHWVEHTHVVLEKLGALSADLISMESARQDYLVAGNANNG
jgi:CHASE3 domain sensor protein